MGSLCELHKGCDAIEGCKAWFKYNYIACNCIYVCFECV